MPNHTTYSAHCSPSVPLYSAHLSVPFEPFVAALCLVNSLPGNRRACVSVQVCWPCLLLPSLGIPSSVVCIGFAPVHSHAPVAGAVPTRGAPIRALPFCNIPSLPSGMHLALLLLDPSGHNALHAQHHRPAMAHHINTPSSQHRESPEHCPPGIVSRAPVFSVPLPPGTWLAYFDPFSSQADEGGRGGTRWVDTTGAASSVTFCPACSLRTAFGSTVLSLSCQ